MICPYKIEIPEATLVDLKRRLQQSRFPGSIASSSWEDGTSLAFMQRLLAYWRDEFDWRKQETRLNNLPHFKARLDDFEIHFLHQLGRGPAPLPLVLTHGWPGSFVEMERLIPMLSDPAAYDADDNDAFDVVVPSLPGYGFSPAPAESDTSSRNIAELWRGLMHELGYERFGAQGGDIGAGVSSWLARLFPEDVVGIHLNYIPGSFRPGFGVGTRPIDPEEKAFLDRAAAWADTEGAYSALQATKPQTLAFALADSPIGLAAWICEKIRSWTDCGGDIEQVMPLDVLLTDISLYWFGDATSALRLYKNGRMAPLSFKAGERVAPPVGVAVFPFELPMPPRSWVERVFDVRQWNYMPAGGHFAAFEQPDLLVREIRSFFRPLRNGRSTTVLSRAQ